uniref:Uncharacterized protein n=1 Tax=Chromera velia CCMP2878 TaxID=1169474 RepID=A0A0G4HLN6_9ALVE|eukprot:Cvel_7367.t1-p1 / transcript=Cvel_7367.t1 / gene=Cvel_7367 / organism=Chromera_velia_CCMP2878 / gene_product=hypothetical protein / transcript_product=hypothetical protein / location=Cvel_scaffold383:45487-46224(+) / protein_length=246 / sequence_SO=supercontig / SO=protein_coding / is_pseudo=false
MAAWYLCLSHSALVASLKCLNSAHRSLIVIFFIRLSHFTLASLLSPFKRAAFMALKTTSLIWASVTFGFFCLEFFESDGFEPDSTLDSFDLYFIVSVLQGALAKPPASIQWWMRSFTGVGKHEEKGDDAPGQKIVDLLKKEREASQGRKEGDVTELGVYSEDSDANSNSEEDVEIEEDADLSEADFNEGENESEDESGTEGAVNEGDKNKYGRILIFDTNRKLSRVDVVVNEFQRQLIDEKDDPAL